ncbi:MAG: hypothetical protein J0I79_04670 [Mesorhizobium sp.]|uniref:helix-turn-helix transcriptional regulator n=1 Tax=Mesorhizobium sp. TaxID=1871066 RepID=UPI001ACCD6FD|nr:hypothetical protein [Mesorhizobium sp.]MBN9217223.1 hypothetical protein [Mesorhizobium sp.]
MADTETRFLDALYRGATEDASLRDALVFAQAMFDCQAGALVSIDTRMPMLGSLALTSGVLSEHERLYAEQFSDIDPAPSIFAGLAPGAASSTDRLMSRDMRLNDPFVQEFFRPIGLVETLGGTLLRDRARFSLIGLQRGSDRPGFDDDDIARLERLIPHIRRALQLRQAFHRMEAKTLGLQAAMDRLPAGMALLDQQGSAIFINAAMRAIVRKPDGLALDRSGRPVPANVAARRRCDELLRDVSLGGAGGMVTVPRPSGERDYVVLVAPGTAVLAEMDWDRRGRAGTIVLVHDPAGRPLMPAELLEQAMNLPKGAARVVAALAMDDDLKSFAEREGVTIHTARFHLHTALAKTGARTQVELVRLAMRILRDIALSSGAAP